MDWYDWKIALLGLLHFIRTYDTVEMYYDILDEDMDLLGTGALFWYA